MTGRARVGWERGAAVPTAGGGAGVSLETCGATRFRGITLSVTALTAATVVSAVDGIVEYATTQDRDSGTFVHLVYFVQDTDGIWKILGM